MTNERYERLFVTGDGTLTLTIDAPVGYIVPPKVELHRSGVGPVTFYDAECYAITPRAGVSS